MNKKTLWNAILDDLKLSNQVTEVSYNTWIMPLKPLHLADGVLLLKTDNSFGLEVLSNQYRPLLLSIAQKTDPTVTTVRFTLEDNVPVPKAEIADDSDEEDKSSDSPSKEKKRERAKKEKPQKYQHPLNQKFTFNSFITAHENSFAVNGASAIAENPGARRFNPLYIFGDHSSGKTHLLHAIGNKVRKERPNFKIVLTTAEEFYYNFYSSLNNKSVERFQKLFSSADLLLVDEVHQFAGKEGCQMELFKIFNTLHQKGKQMVFTAERPQEELKGIDERLISRLQWGLAVGIEPPNLETRTAILAEMTQKEGLEISAEVLSFLGENGPNAVGDLEGIVIRLSAYSSFNNKPITLAVAKELLERPEGMEDQQISVAKILKNTAKHYQVAQSLILGKGRSKEVALSRQVGMYIAKSHTELSLKAIGLEFGGRDHSTVVHAVKTIEKKRESDPELNTDIETILEICRKER